MLGEAVESCQALRPWATRPTLPSANSARSHRDGAALGVLQRCADEESASRLSIVGAPCTTPNGAPTFISIFANSSTKLLGIYDELDLTVARLRTGDYLVDGSVLIERKTVSDFALSIIDARLFRQARRLNKSGYRPAFLIEGSPTRLGSMGMSRDSLQGVLICLTLIFNIPVFRSLDQEESARILAYTAHQLRRRGQGFHNRGYRKPNTRKVKQLRILQTLPGIGKDRAQSLLRQFGSLERCVTASRDDLMKVNGIGRKTAEAIRGVVSESKAPYFSRFLNWDL